MVAPDRVGKRELTRYAIVQDYGAHQRIGACLHFSKMSAAEMLISEAESKLPDYGCGYGDARYHARAGHRTRFSAPGANVKSPLPLKIKFVGRNNIRSKRRGEVTYLKTDGRLDGSDQTA